MKVCYIFGGSGYIGTFLANHFVNSKLFDKIYALDIKKPRARVCSVEYIDLDVRQPIEVPVLENCDSSSSWIFNLAAVHREPGHDAHEYFDTNIRGAININAFAEAAKINNLFFTSSIAPYGRSREVRNEESPCYPETPYGISKWKAESIHQIWLEKDTDRRLVICRPSVIYGPGDPGNVLRMIRGVKKGLFFIPGSPEIIKSHGYIHGLVDSVEFTMGMDDRLITYNYAENPCACLGDMVKETKHEFGIKRIVPRIPMFLLVVAATVISWIIPKSPIHPVRVRKAGFPTNIEPGFLISRGFEFKYSFAKSLKHWRSVSDKDFD